MAETRPSHATIDPRSGFCSETKTFFSLRPCVPLPPLYQPLSVADYTRSLLHSTTAATSATTFLIHATTGQSLSYSQFLHQSQTLATSLQSLFPSLSKGHVAFVLSPASLHVPVIYFSLLSLGITVSPANPLSSESELAHTIQLSKPVIAFATRSVSHKLPSLPLGTIFIDSPQFQSMTTGTAQANPSKQVEVNQSDSAAILYSSGTTGRVKGVEITHRNLIALIAGMYHNKLVSQGNSPATEPEPHPVSLFTLPLFHPLSGSISL